MHFWAADFDFGSGSLVESADLDIENADRSDEGDNQSGDALGAGIRSRMGIGSTYLRCLGGGKGVLR